MKTNAENQAAFKKRQGEKGVKKKCFWVTDEQHERLKSLLLTLQKPD